MYTVITVLLFEFLVLTTVVITFVGYLASKNLDRNMYENTGPSRLP